MSASQAMAGSEDPPVCCKPGNSGSNTASDHVETTRLATTQFPKKYRCGRHALVRTDSADGTTDTSAGSQHAADVCPARWA
ncbi:hypothetical protein [Streptomyces sp. NPDC046751]|uniref:hypothetical protein n=2 Tax=Streptomyces TaxID=1883 RepID=UPI0033DAA6E2